MPHKRFLLGCALVLGLAACATDGNVPALPKSAPPAAVCPPVRTYSPEEQKALAAALRALPDGSPLVGAMIDYGALRDAARAACSAH